ncbi:LysR substrate-binding domain-containing protein [Ruminococcus sp.]|uniref:LysR substrate-binding domain-containing protein n=1 Tax=Ruminococcus sp. TaxID=41978 RepID=UPI003AB887D3
MWSFAAVSLCAFARKITPLAKADSLDVDDISGRPIFIERHTCPDEIFALQHRILANGKVDKIIFCGDYESAVAMAEAGLGFMIFPAIEDAYKGPLKAIPIKGVKEISFGVYYLRSQLEKQAKDMLGILKNQFAK